MKTHGNVFSDKMQHNLLLDSFQISTKYSFHFSIIEKQTRWWDDSRDYCRNIK